MDSDLVTPLSSATVLSGYCSVHCCTSGILPLKLPLKLTGELGAQDALLVKTAACVTQSIAALAPKSAHLFPRP